MAWLNYYYGQTRKIQRLKYSCNYVADIGLCLETVTMEILLIKRGCPTKATIVIIFTTFFQSHFPFWNTILFSHNDCHTRHGVVSHHAQHHIRRAPHWYPSMHCIFDGLPTNPSNPFDTLNPKYFTIWKEGWYWIQIDRHSFMISTHQNRKYPTVTYYW